MFKNYLKTIIALIIIISMVGIPFAQVYALSEEDLLKSLGITQDKIKELQLQTEENNPQGELNQSDEKNSQPTPTETPTETPALNEYTEQIKQDSTTSDSTETPKEENGESTPENVENKDEKEEQDDNFDKGTYVSTLLIDYAGVSIKRTHSLDKVRFTVTNQEALQIGKVTIDDKEVAYIEDSENKEYKYFEYSGDTKVIKVEFYRKNMEEPFSTIYVQILKDDKGYHTNMAPIIKYGQEEDTSRLFEIKDGSKIKEIVIYKSNSKNDYRDENIVFKYTDGKVESINKTYIEIVEQTEESFKIKINKEENDAIYKIIATDKSDKELIHQREVRLIGMKENVATMQLDYTGVSIKTENYLINKENKLKFTINNQDKVKVDRVKIIPTDSENTDELKISNSTFYYEQGTDLLKLEFYKKGQNTAFNEMYVYVRKDEIGKYHVNFSPTISYGEETNDYRSFNVSDLNGMNDIIVYRLPNFVNTKVNYSKEEYEKAMDNAEIVYQYQNDGIDKIINDKYIDIRDVIVNTERTEGTIKILKRDKYEYYKIVVKDKSSRNLIQERYVKVAGKVSPLQAVTTWDTFTPTISVNRNNLEKITFNLNKDDKVTSVKAEEVIAGKVNTEAPIENIEKYGNYVTSFTFNREGMYKFTFSNGKDYSYVYYVITVKSNGEGWGLNRSPLVTTSEDNKYEKIDIADSSVYSIEINRRVDGKYTENVFKWENGKIVKNEGANKIVYVGGVDKSKEGHVYLNLLKKEENNAFQIKVTDKNGAIQLITDRRVSVAKLPETNTSKSGNKTKDEASSDSTKSSTNNSKSTTDWIKQLNLPTTTQFGLDENDYLVDSFNPDIKTEKLSTGLKLTVAKQQSNIKVNQMEICKFKGMKNNQKTYNTAVKVANNTKESQFTYEIKEPGIYRILCGGTDSSNIVREFIQYIVVTKNSNGEFGGNRSPVVTTVDDGNYEKVIVKDANINRIIIKSANKPGSNATAYNDTIFDFDNTSGPFKGVSGFDNNRVYKVDKSEKQVTIWIKKQTAGKYKYKVIATDEAKYDGKTINLTTDRRLWVDKKASTVKSTSSNSNNKPDATWENDADASWSEAGNI